MKNKKTLVIVAAVVVVLAVVLAVVFLGGNKTPTPATEKEYKLGMGLEIGTMNNTEVSATVATVVLDNAGKIVACRVDAIQNKFTLAEDGTFTIGNTKTKVELGYNYNMAAFGHSLIGNEKAKEWFEQGAAFEAWVVGKTANEIKNMKLQTMSNGYVIADEADLLNAGCTISIEELRDAVVKACNDAQGVSFKTAGTFTLGLAANSADSDSKAATEEADGAIQVYSDIACTVVADGKILATLNDAIQPKVTFDATGAVTGTSFKGTKRELKEGYNMAAFGHSLVGNEKVVEWYLQSAAFSAHVTGMTKAQLKAMPTQTASNGYVISNDQELLNAGCTMSIDAIIDVVAKAIDNAK
jgi:hypothetical protein